MSNKHSSSSSTEPDNESLESPARLRYDAAQQAWQAGEALRSYGTRSLLKRVFEQRLLEAMGRTSEVIFDPTITCSLGHLWVEEFKQHGEDLSCASCRLLMQVKFRTYFQICKFLTIRELVLTPLLLLRLGLIRVLNWLGKTR